MNAFPGQEAPELARWNVPRGRGRKNKKKIHLGGLAMAQLGGVGDGPERPKIWGQNKTRAGFGGSFPRGEKERAK